MTAKIDPDKCIACGACVSVCPAQAITLNEKASVDATKCKDNKECAAVCPMGAISSE